MADYKPEVHIISGMEQDISEIPMATHTFSTIPDALVTLLTLSDVGRLPKFKMADCKPEVRSISGMELDISEIPTATHTFSTTPGALVTPLTLSDVSRLPKFKMADSKPEVRSISGMEQDISEIPTATHTFSTIPYSPVGRGWSKM